MTAIHRHVLGVLLASACSGPDPQVEVTTSAVLAFGGEQQLSNAPVNITNLDPFVVFGNGHYFAAWQDSRQLGSPQPLSTGSALFTQTSSIQERVLENVTLGDGPSVAAAASASSYMVVTNQRVNKQDVVRGQIVDLTGAPFGSSFLIDEVDKLDNSVVPTVAVGSDGQSYLALWGQGPGAGVIRAAQFSPTGGVIAVPFGLIGNARDPEIAFDGTNYLVVFVRVNPGTQTDVFAQRVSTANAFVGPEIEIARTANRDEGHAVACSASTCVVTWRTGTAIRAMRIAANGTVLDPGGDVVGTVAGTVRHTTAAFDGTDFVIAWRTNSELRASRFAVDGTLIDSNVLVVAPSTPPENAQLASDGAGQLALVYDRLDTATNRQRVRLIRTTPAGGGVDAGAADAPIATDAAPDAANPDGGGGPVEDNGGGPALLSDATTGGTTGFFFLAPLVDPPASFPGTFDGSFSPRLRITVHDVDCQQQGNVGAVVQAFETVLAYPASQQYKVTFNIGGATYVSGNCYRVIPRFDGAALGHRDVQALAAGQPLPGYKKWGIGANTTIAFRLENMDPDGDGLASHVDNCDTVANANQSDHEGDGLGDVCDPDDDNDDIPDTSDNCALAPNTDQANHDSDAAGDACDGDDDNDGVPDGSDNCVIVANADQADSDSDGIGDACDLPACATAPGAIGAWPGDNSTEDTVGNADGTFGGTPAFAPAVVGPAGFSFTGTNSVRAAAFDYSGPFTVAFWAKPNVVQAQNTGLLGSAETGGTEADLANTFQIDWDGAGHYRMRLGGSGTKLFVDIGSANTVEFKHVAVTYETSGLVRTFLDGRGVGSAVWTGPPLVFTGLRLGVNRGGSQKYSGIIDDVHVFGRVLDLAEIAAIFDAGANGVCP